MTAIIRLNAMNDTNGNPRRCYVRIGDGGAVTGAWDEGYKGIHAVPERYLYMAQNAPTFETTPAQYRALLREFGAEGSR